MISNIEDLGATKKKMSVEVPAETVTTEVDLAVENLRRVAKLKGFRPGKTPKNIVRKLFWPQIEHDVTQKLVQASLPEALKESGHELASQPILEEAKLTEKQPFTFSVTFEIKPRFDLEGYRGLNLTREKIEVTEEMVEAKLADLRQAYATTQSIAEDRPVNVGDLAVVDYQAFTADGPLEGGANPHYQLEVGSGRFHPDFEAALEGLTKGQDKEITVNFPADHYNPRLADQEIRFQVKLVDIKEKIIPELDDQFAKDLGLEVQDMEGLRAKLRDDLMKAEKDKVERKLQEQVKDRLTELAQFEAPESMVADELESMISRTSFNLRRSGISLEAMGLSETKLREEYRPQADKRVRVALILEKIAKDQDLTTTDREVDDELMVMARNMGQSVEAVREIYNKNNMIDMLKHGILAEKALKFVIDDATIEEVESSPETAPREAEES